MNAHRHQCRQPGLHWHPTLQNFQWAARLKSLQQRRKHREEARVRAEDPPTTHRRVTAAATSSMKLPSPKVARWLQSQERNLGAMVTVSFQLTTILNEEDAESANRHCPNEGSGKEKRESACAMTTGAIHPSTEREGYRWIQARGGPLETATMN